MAEYRIAMWICSECDGVNWLKKLKKGQDRTTMTCGKCGSTKELIVVHYDYTK